MHFVVHTATNAGSLRNMFMCIYMIVYEQFLKNIAFAHKYVHTPFQSMNQIEFRYGGCQNLSSNHHNIKNPLSSPLRLLALPTCFVYF